MPQPLDDAEEPRDLGVGEGARRLVHDQDRRVERQRLGDLDDLLVADPQVADRRAGSDLAFRAASNSRRRRGFHRPVVEQAEPAAYLAAQEDVGRDRELFDEVQLLVDDADAGVLGVARAGETHRLAAQAGSGRRSR